MFSDKLRSLKIFFAMALIVTSISAASEINEGDVPEICVVCDGVELKYGIVDTCWPGETISVPVYYTSADTLTYLQIWGTLPEGLSYDTIYTDGTPWPGSLVNYSSGSDIEIHLARGDTLLPDTMAWLLDVFLDVSDDANYDQTYYVKFGHNIAACILGELVDCDVIDTTWGSATIPEDSVVFMFDSVSAYSYQAADHSDQAKIDNPLKVPVKLYTNFPLGSYVLWFRVPDSLNYVGYDSVGAGAQVSEYFSTQYYKVFGSPSAKPGNDSTYYLCDLKFEVGNYRSSYNADQNFIDSIFITTVEGGTMTPRSHVYSWGAVDSICYDSISIDAEGIYLSKYEVSLDIKNAQIDGFGQVEVPVTINPSFWAQYNSLNIGYDSTLLTFTGIDSTGGHIPPIGSISSYPHSGNYAIRQFAATTSDSGLYILPDAEQVLFNLQFEATASFTAHTTTDVKFFVGQTNLSKVYDFFSPSGEVNKIVRNDTMSVWSTSDGTISNPPQLNILVGGPCYYEDNVIRLDIEVEYVNLDDILYCQLAYPDDTPEPFSITEGDWRFDTENLKTDSQNGYVYLMLPFLDEVDTAGTLAHLWIQAEEGTFYTEDSESWAGPSVEKEETHVYFVGDTVYYEWQEPKLATELPEMFFLTQNYPNPFNARTNISFNMAKAGFAELVIYDILGRQMKTLVSEELPAGRQIVDWDGTNAAGKQVAGGVYFYVLKAGDFRESKKMLYLK